MDCSLLVLSLIMRNMGITSSFCEQRIAVLVEELVI